MPTVSTLCIDARRLAGGRRNAAREPITAKMMAAMVPEHRDWDKGLEQHPPVAGTVDQGGLVLLYRDGTEMINHNPDTERHPLLDGLPSPRHYSATRKFLPPP
ncbi:MAG TPA: hypothetical protein VMB34_20965 [Acetobacteraceae bacterium]|nr:hypothetical protein [Acetobacteraceae bacterium]